MCRRGDSCGRPGEHRRRRLRLPPLHAGPGGRHGVGVRLPLAADGRVVVQGAGLHRPTGAVPRRDTAGTPHAARCCTPLVGLAEIGQFFNSPVFMFYLTVLLSAAPVRSRHSGFSVSNLLSPLRLPPSHPLLSCPLSPHPQTSF